MNQERIFQVLIGPHVSEKAAIVADTSNQYVFKVAPNATKAERCRQSFPFQNLLHKQALTLEFSVVQ